MCSRRKYFSTTFVDLICITSISTSYVTFQIKNTTLSVDLTRKWISTLLIIRNDTCTDIEIHVYKSNLCIWGHKYRSRVFFFAIFVCQCGRKAHLALSEEITYSVLLNFESLPALRVTVHVTVLKFIGYYTSNQTLREVSCVHTGSALFELQLKAVASTNGGA